MAELWDLYDENGTKTGETAPRGASNATQHLPKGRYHLVAAIWVCAPDGRFLLIRRAPGKIFPLYWAYPGGSALVGESGLQAALRETMEETGLALSPEAGRLFCRCRSEDSIYDVWLFRQEIDLDGVVLQAGETIGAALAGMDEIRAMIADGSFLPPERVPYFEALTAYLRALTAKEASCKEGEPHRG
ncbi:MAG: NUDIX domain-containing protein [Christensenellaceae bacterium]|jgi:8-oxo-dGTP pyrophosphatase MutT (NUDIX family)|nr:NUDIX domain-containing protein [Christensenellaceae bacterium]